MHRRRQISGTRIATVAAALLLPATVLAHHSFAMFDSVNEEILNGTVTKFEWTNPHTWLELDVLEADGSSKHYSIEGGSVLGLARQGWTRKTLQPGDKIRVVIHPMRTGEPGGSLMGVVTADGRSLGVPLTAPGEQ